MDSLPDVVLVPPDTVPERVIPIALAVALLVVLASTLLPLCLSGSVLEYYGSVLTLAGTLVLGAVTVWQTGQANDIAKKSQERAEEAEKRLHQPQISISEVLYGAMTESDLRSARVLRLKKTGWADDSLREHDDLFYTDEERSGTPRKDLLFLEITNHSPDAVEISVDTEGVRQLFPTAEGDVEFGELDLVPIEPKVISERESVKLVIRDAGRADSEKRKLFDKNWTLVLPFRGKNLWTEETQTWQVLYMITKKSGYQAYDITSVKQIGPM